jgi:thiosulfate reductase cytochrome b subunit
MAHPTWWEALVASLYGVLGTIIRGLVKLVGFVVIVVIGWFISSLVARAVTAILRGVHFSELANAPDRVTGSRDYLADAGAALARHLPGDVPRDQLRFWFYRHFSLGVYALAPALRLHWMFAYLFMGCGLLYLAGLVNGGGYRSLLPRRSDPREALQMMRYYFGLVPMRILRRPWGHPRISGKYNALQRGAYLSMPLFGLLAIASGWAMHKPAQLGWLERLFGSYDGARVVHFVTMWVFIAFLVPHVILVIGDGWDTMRSMIVGWSRRSGESHE